LAITKGRKEELVAEYVDMLRNSQGVVVTEYRGMKMAQLDALRSKLRETNGGFTVTKNTLLKIALREVGMAVPDDLLNGPVALAVAYEDLAQTIKAVLDFSEGNEIFIVKGGVIGTSAVGSDRLEAISNLPPLDMLRAQLLGTITMPLTQLVGLMNEPGRQVVAVIQAATDGLVNVLAAYSQKGEAA
jgi:large subunit ribosomal protein L10